MYLFDTNHCSLLIEGEPKVVNLFRERSEAIISISAIVVGELRFMAQNSQQRTANLVKIQSFLQRIHVYSIDNQTAETYGDFKSEVISHFGPKEKRKRQTTKLTEIGINENDLWIAATALHHSLIVVSCDSDFQRLRQVRKFSLENWV